jgi:hypothetical protein
VPACLTLTHRRTAQLVASNPTEHLVGTPSGDTLFAARARRAKVGLDVLLTKAAIDFQNLGAERDDPLLRHNLEALREAGGLDAVLIATFDETGNSI